MVAANNNIASLIHQKPSFAGNQQSSQKDMEPIFEDFSWYGGKVDEDTLVQDVRDVTDGLTVVLGLIEMNDIRLENEERPLFSPLHRSRLMRLSIATQRVLAGVCDTEIQASNERARRVESQR
jgi:hypothetical protein